MMKDEKIKLRFNIDLSCDHVIVSANILLFLERRNYIDINVDQHQGWKFKWNEQVVHAAIEYQMFKRRVALVGHTGQGARDEGPLIEGGCDHTDAG